MSKQITGVQAAAQLETLFQKIQRKSPARPLQARVFSQKLGLNYTYPSNSTNQPYHLASIGKLFTATLIQLLAGRGAFSINDPICRFFTPEELDRLFVYKGNDYASQVTIEHLLGHTSGIADYFEGLTTTRESFLDGVVTDRDHLWTPAELVDFTRANQQAVGRPGQRYNYSDTGYILLGQLVEKVTGKPFAQNLADEIFRPLDMRDTYLMFCAEPLNTPKKPIAEIWIGKQEVSQYNSLSCDWSGGGIVSTTADLLKFSQALRGGLLLPASTLAEMDKARHKFRAGIHYGLGMMEIHFNEFFFLLRGLPKVYGHIGILATHLFYDPIHEAHIILNFGATDRMVESFQALIQIENILQKIYPPGHA